MEPEATIRVAEVFRSLQGEGPSLGTPSTFVRLQGCTVGCAWCDTRYSWPADGNNFAPRLAVTWDPTGSAQTVVRTAYGLYYDPIITATAGITRYISGQADTVRTFVLPFPNSRIPWLTPDRVSRSSAQARANLGSNRTASLRYFCAPSALPGEFPVFSV